MKLRRTRLAKKGICGDCQLRPIKPGVSRQNKPHRSCEICLQARRDRWHNGGMPPLFREIQKNGGVL
jgi:hypothetical protein